MKKLIDMLNRRILSMVLIVFVFATFVFASVIIDNSQSDFDLGTYNQTEYNSGVGSGAVQLNLSYNNGTYTSQIFDTGSNVTLNNLSWGYQRIQCSEGMAYINKLNGYCIDKYEASVWNSDGTWNSESNTSTWNAAADTDAALAAGAYANSSEGKYPWVYIDQTEARTACANYPGGNKYLCTDEQWLGAANIKGQIYNLPLELTDCTVNEGTDCDWADSPGGGDACMTGNKADCVSSEGVYDMVGNVWEWTNITMDVINPLGNSTTGTGTVGWYYFNGTGWGVATAKYGNDGVYFPKTIPGNAVRRGGSWSYGPDAGPFCARLSSAPTSTYHGIGFRCCSS